MNTSAARIVKLEDNERFVFGSNTGGIHGAGAANLAHRHFGAHWLVGSGPTGKCYAIPTKDALFRVLPTSVIKENVDNFFYYAEHHPDLKFLVTEIGCGLAGYDPKDIAPLFERNPMPDNIHLPARFWAIINAT